MRCLVSQNKRRPSLNRNQTRTLLNTVRVVTTAGAISLTVAGWGLLANLDAGNVAQAKNNQPLAMIAPASDPNIKKLTSASTKAAIPATPPAAKVPSSTAPAAPTAQPIRRLDIVQWLQDAAGNQVAVVRDRRGTLWYMMGSDIPRIEQGQASLIQPQPVQVFSRSRAS